MRIHDYLFCPEHVHACIGLLTKLKLQLLGLGWGLYTNKSKEMMCLETAHFST